VKVRSVTVGADLGDGPDPARLATAPEFLRTVRERLAGAGLEVQTTRLALPRYNRPAGRLADFGRRAEETAAALGFDYVSVGPVAAGEGAAEAIAELIAGTERVFAAVEVARGRAVDLPAVETAARAIKLIAARTAAGFGNLRFAALANCPPGIPFLPAAYHDGGSPAVSVALEAADLAVEAFGGDRALEGKLAAWEAAVKGMVGRVGRLVRPLAARFGWRYLGADPTPAPFPETGASIGAALERLGGGEAGGPGTLFLSAVITGRLRRLRVRKAGFSGLMLPILEDNVLARRFGEGKLPLAAVLAFSAVCGTGLDVVPLPEDVTEAELRGILLDVAALSAVLQKPLTARLMPVPGLKPGGEVRFDFPYFADARLPDFPRPAAHRPRFGSGRLEV
jgi:uncharacterized protein (UPF0210 family)